MNESVLEEEAQQAQRAVLARFECQKFGTAVGELRAALAQAVDKEFG